MQISTLRFGRIRVRTDDLLLFPHALIGYEDCRRWVLLADTQHDAVGWLQSASRPDVALAVISPRRFVPDYRVRVSGRQLAPLELGQHDRAFVLTVMANDNGRLTINLKAPLILNLDRRLGRQIITSDDQPLQWELTALPLQLRRSA